MNYEKCAEPRYSLAFGRMSTAPRSSLAARSLSGRPSMLVVAGAGSKRVLNIPRQTTMKDSRSVSDRGRQADMINHILEFLSSRDPPFQYSERMIRSPSKNDFKVLFEFMFRELDETYSVQKIEDEIPRIFSAMGYPFPIKNSTMVTIGAQHSWPSLLAALDWLIDMIEIENSLDDESLGANQLAYSYFTTCYKKKMDAVGSDQVDFSEQLNTFRMLMMQDENAEEEFQKIYSRRIENESQLKDVLYEIEEETKKIHVMESNIRDLESDVSALKKFQKEIQVAISKIEQNIEEAEIGLQRYNEKFFEIDEENKKKEVLISTQKVSAEEARALLIKRNNIKANLFAMRDELNNTDTKNFELQPKAYKQWSQIRGEFRTVLTGFQDLCSALLPSEMYDNIDWNLYDYDKVWAEFLKNTDSELGKLIESIKTEIECLVENYRMEKRKIERTVEDKNREMREIETAAEKDEQDHILKVDQISRDVEDIASLIQKANCELDVVQSRRQTAKLEFQKIHDRCTDIRDRLAETQKLYLQQRNDLDKAYSDIAAGVCEKVSHLWIKLEQIVAQKESWKELGNRILKQNRQTLDELRRKRRNRTENNVPMNNTTLVD